MQNMPNASKLPLFYSATVQVLVSVLLLHAVSLLMRCGQIPSNA